MRRHYFTAFLFALLMTCGTGFAGTAVETQEQAIAAAMAAMANEPALTQADVDSFLAYAPQMAEAGSDEAKLLEIFQKHNLSPQRFGIISTKISVGLMMAQGITKEQIAAMGQIPEFMIPSASEIELIAKNTDAIVKAMQ